MLLPPWLPRRDLLVSTTALFSLQTPALPLLATSLGTPLPIALGAADGREYGFVRLPNGLRALLVSGGARCEIALTVQCGSLDDSDEFEGLAHLAEHLTLAAGGEALGGAAPSLKPAHADEHAGRLRKTRCSNWRTPAPLRACRPR